MQVDQNGPTQHDLAVKAMFVKGENLARRARRPANRLLRSADGTPAYLVKHDRTGAPYKIFRSVEWFDGKVRQR